MTLLPMENKESILCALKCFEKEKSSNIPPILDDYIKQIAKNGQTMLPWIYVKPLMLCKYNKVMDGFLTDYSEFMPVAPTPTAVAELRQRVYNTLKRLDGIPFTIQRLCELLENPFRHYTRPDKFLRGLEKVLMVVSTVDPQGNKIHREDPRFPSHAGMEECSLIINDTLMSPPNSPLTDSLHGQHTSKSSDEDVTEDENGDENEEEEEAEEDREGTDESVELTPADDVPARDSMGAPQAMPTLAKVGTSSCAWSFESKSASRPNLPVHPSTNEDDNTIGNVERNKDHSEVNSERVPRHSTASPDGEPAPFTTTAVVATPALELLDSGSQSVDAPRDSREEGKPAVEDDEAEYATVDGASSSGETVPPIRQILRPIGQLEAFVQNMATDVPNAPSVPGRSTNSSGVADDSETELASSSNTSAQKRRAPASPPSPSPTTSSSDSSDMNPDDSVAASSREPLSPESLQSPAKRRRLASLAGPQQQQQQQQNSDSSTSGSEAVSLFPCTLNNSPPIILCNPLPSSGRDRESGECVPSGPSVQSDAVDEHIRDAPSMQLDARSTDMRGGTTEAALPGTGSSSVRIDLETGEEEEEREQAMDESEEDGRESVVTAAEASVEPGAANPVAKQPDEPSQDRS